MGEPLVPVRASPGLRVNMPSKLFREACEACAEPVAPVRKRGSPLLAAQDRVRGPRCTGAELLARDAPDAAVEGRLLEDGLRELRPRALPVRGEVPDAELGVAAREAHALPPRDGRRRSGILAGRRRPQPRRARRRGGASSGRSCGRSPRTATTSGPPTPDRPPPPRRGASSARTPRGGSASPTRRTARPSSRRTRSPMSTRRAAHRALPRAPFRRRWPRRLPADRPRRRPRSSTQPCGGRGRVSTAAQGARRGHPSRGGPARARRRRRTRARARPRAGPRPR